MRGDGRLSRARFRILKRRRPERTFSRLVLNTLNRVGVRFIMQ